MPKLRTLSGSEVLAIRGDFGFRPLSQRGSHVKVSWILKTAKRKRSRFRIIAKSTEALFTLSSGRLAASLRNLNCVASSSPTNAEFSGPAETGNAPGVSSAIRRLARQTAFNECEPAGAVPTCPHITVSGLCKQNRMRAQMKAGPSPTLNRGGGSLEPRPGLPRFQSPGCNICARL
jgi:hypothetical protein